MAIDITNHKCPACTGPLHFSGASGMLECDYCGQKPLDKPYLIGYSTYKGVAQ